MTTHTSRHELVAVTGASTGIGRATGERLVRAGYDVLGGVRTPADAEEIRRAGIEPVVLDVTDPEQIQSLRERIERDPAGRPLRALVNNAGIAINAPVEVIPLPDWRRQLEVSVLGPVAMIQSLLPALMPSGGRVVNIGSLGSRVAMPGFGAYSAAKFAMDAVNDSLRREMAPFGVRVVLVTPGAVKTQLTGRGLAEADRVCASMTPEQQARYAPLMAAYRATVEEWARTGVEADSVARTVETAITARSPRTRYTVGRDAGFMMTASRLASDRILDRMVRRSMKLPVR